MLGELGDVTEYPCGGLLEAGGGPAVACDVRLWEEVQPAVRCWVGTGQDVWGVVDAGRESREYTIRGRGRGRQMKRRKSKDRTNAIRIKGEDGGNEGKDGLENENMRVYSTCRVRTAGEGTLAGSSSEDCETRLHQAGCTEQLENDEIWWG
jgi:hypothetical protein